MWKESGILQRMILSDTESHDKVRGHRYNSLDNSVCQFIIDTHRQIIHEFSQSLQNDSEWRPMQLEDTLPLISILVVFLIVGFIIWSIEHVIVKKRTFQRAWKQFRSKKSTKKFSKSRQ